MNIYLQQLSQIIPKSKYLNTYLALCHKALARANTKTLAKQLLGYVEKHHILPAGFKLGGKLDAQNYVYLTAREHFICHKLLVLSTIGTQFYQTCTQALHYFTLVSSKTQRPILTSHNFEFVRKHKSISFSGKNNSRYGRHDAAHNKGIPCSEEIKRKISESKKGRRQTAEIVLKRSAAYKAKNHHHQKITCEHCGKSCANNVYVRWHGNNCCLIKPR